MATLAVTQEVLCIIAANARSTNFQSVATLSTDGLWLVPVEDDVMRFIEQRLFVGETDAEVVLRLLVSRSGLN